MSLGLVLSGGGARGIAHIGALQVFKEKGIVPDMMSGTSSGALVAALYASGMEPEEILNFVKETEIFSLKKYARSKPGFVDTEKFYDRFLDYFKKDSFEVLSIPIKVPATNLLDGGLEVFSEGELIRPILASAAFPGVFAPVKIGDSYYVDGGVLNNFPVDLIANECEKIIGIYVNPFEKRTYKDFKHSLSVLERAYQIRTANDSLSKFKRCTLVISPSGLKQFNIFNLTDLDTIYQLGYEAALRTLDASEFVQE